VEPDPAKFWPLGAARIAADFDVLSEGHGIDLGDLQRLRVGNRGQSGCRDSQKAPA
jgi:hypothetical protein